MQTRYLIGTLFEQEQQNKKMNFNNTKLKDPMGNTRWKGAFTGGFQAGYKNTCGSKQGWMPSSFVSSVGNRQQIKEQNIFDFMDKEDLGRESIGQNMSMNKNFSHSQNNPLGLKEVESMGQKILNKMKKNEAFINAPENPQQLQKLLENYQKQEQLGQDSQVYNLKGIQGYESVGADGNVPDDDFITAYQDFFRKVIRASAKEETQQEIAKRREENKIYFDFTRPLDEQPEYLKEIQDLEQAAKPKKRRRNTINDKKLKDLFVMAKSQLSISNPQSKLDEVPQDYDPYHRIKNMKENDKQFIANIEQKKKHKFFTLSQRSDLLNEGKLSNRFVTAGTTISTNKFVRASQEEKTKEVENVFQDRDKNKRYWDYVMELQGQKISAQLQYLSYQQAEKEKEEFQKMYHLRQIQQKNQNKLPKKVQDALKSGAKKEIKFVRKVGNWKPEKLLCKRFGCLVPYKQDLPKQNKNRYQNNF